MVVFINVKLIWIQLQICFSEETNFSHPKWKRPLLCSQLTACTKPAALLLLYGDWAVLLRLQTSSVTAYSRVGRAWRAWWTTLDVTSVKICLSCLSAMNETLEFFKLRACRQWHTAMLESHAKRVSRAILAWPCVVWLCNVQKSVTQIIYLWPLPIERYQSQGHYPDEAIRSSEGFQTNEGRWY